MGDVPQDRPLAPCQAAGQQEGLNWKPALNMQQAREEAAKLQGTVK